MNFKIWHKMIIGITIPSLIALAGGIFTYEYINDVKHRHGFVEIADDLKGRALEVRRNEKNFLLHKTDPYYKYCQDAISGFNNSVDSISEEIVDQIGKDDFLLLRHSTQAYSGLIYALLRNYQQETDVIERVREEGRKLETFVASGKHARELSINFILDMRRWEKNYMLFRDKASFDKLNLSLSLFNNIIPFCFECARYTEAIHTLFSVYNEIDTKVNDLQIIGTKLEEITNKIASRERQKVSDFFTHTQRLLLMALILLCTLGPLIVYKTATYIVAPIKRLADITRKISEGDITLRAPIREHDETFTLAVSFNKMLDHLQLTQESLEKSMELLREKQEEAEKRASLGFLVSGVAHELNNPLNNISLTAETMKEDIKELSPEQMAEYVQDILAQCERAQQVVENLLDFAGARKSSSKNNLNIVSVVQESINLIANQLKVNNINLRLDFHDSILFIKGNRSKLEEVFINLMVNAVHAMKDSGTLSISIKPDSEINNVFIEIGDTGCGISQKDLKNIFEPFFTTKPVGEGTGLGLSVARSLILEHEGEIDVDSTEGVGTTFIIRLPLIEGSV
ncbi:MAG: HAMP domain-containing protein [Nitrospirae bacterium]|nr:HAMP domain-containing protein [Nitrospirota bacterium]